MSEKNEIFSYGEPKVVGKVFDGRVHFMTLVEGSIPFVLVYQKGKTEYSPSYYEVLYGDFHSRSFDDCPYLVKSKDGKSILYVVVSNEGYYLYLNDKEMRGPEEFICNLDISDDCKNYAYMLQKDELWEVYFNNQKFNKSFRSHSALLFLPDGSLDFLGENDGIWHYYSTTKGELPEDFLKVGWFFPSPVCDRVGFFCAKSTDGKWYVYINDKEILGPFDCMGLPMTISPSGKNYTFTVVRGEEWYIYINDQKVNRSFGVIDFLSFLPNNKDIVCSEVKDDGTRLYVNDKLIAGPFEKLGFEMFFSPDCKRVYYSQRKDGKWLIGHTDIDDTERKFIKDIDVTIPCSEVFNLLVSPDLSRIVYSSILEKKNFLNDESIVSLGDLGTFGVFESIFFFKMSSDGSVIAFTAKEDEDWYLYVNGKKVSGPFLSIPLMTFYKNTPIIIYKAVISDDEPFPVSMMYMDGKNYTGEIDMHRMMYMDGENIVLRERIKD